MTNPRPKIRREELKPGEVLCDYCTARCCRYYALPLDTPDTRAEMDYIRWYMLHGQTAIFTENETWYLLVNTTCKHLRDDNLCGIYDTRPAICREYSTDNCEYDDSHVYDRYFETSEQVEEYMDAIFQEPERFRTPRPAMFPILT